MKIVLSLAAAASVAVLAGPATATERTDLTIAVTSLSPSLDPMGSNSNDNERISRNLVENLVVYDPATSTIKPWLATSWTQVNPTTLDLTIREGVKCHNGEDFDATDVAYMFGPARYSSKDSPGHAVALQFLSTIDKVEAVNSHLVRITTHQPDPLLLKRLAGWMGQVPCADAFKSAASWEQWGQHVVGTGPYKIDRVAPDDYQRFVAFDGYWGKKAPASSITFKVVPEMAARIAGLISGEYDLITEIQPDQFSTIEGNAKTEVVGGPINNIRTLAYDTRNPALKDPRIRRAMNLAINRQLLVDTLFAGKTTVPNGMQLQAFGDMYIADHKAAGYDPDEARRLLKEAGYNGAEISYRYLKDYYSGEVDTAQALEQMWRDVGLNVKLDLKENWDQIETPQAAPGRGVINWSTTGYFDDPIGQIWRMFGPEGSFQPTGFYDGTRFNTFKDGLFDTDLKKRQEAERGLLDVFEQDPPATYLYVLPMFYGKKKDVVWSPGDHATAFMDFRADSLSFGTAAH